MFFITCVINTKCITLSKRILPQFFNLSSLFKPKAENDNWNYGKHSIYMNV